MRTKSIGAAGLLPCLFAVAWLLLLAVEAHGLTAPASIAYCEGTVLVLRKGEAQPVRAELGMSLFYGDQVKTVVGKCQINMTASGVLRLSPHTTVLFPAEENAGDKISVVRMLEGKTRTNLAKLYEEISVDLAVFRTNREIARLRAEGNARLDAIRAELQALEGKPLGRVCGKGCGSSGPHRWTPDGWECACGATVLRLSDYPTAQGAYAAVRADFQQRIQELEEKAERLRNTVLQDLETRTPSLVAGTQG